MSEKDISGTTPETEAEVLNGAAASDNGVETSVSPTETPDVKADAPSAPEASKDVKTVKPVSMLDKVKDILGVNKTKAPAEASTAESDDKDPGDKAAAEKAEAKKPEEKKADDKSAEVPKEFAKHPAWQRILKERDTFKTQATEYQKVQGFLQETGVSGADAAKSLQMAALIYHNPQEAYKQLTELMGNLAIQIGAALPDDLQKDVEEGQISEVRAKELSKARVDASMAQGRVQATQETLTQVQDQNVFSERARTFDAWVEATGKTDPDIAKKLPFLVGALKTVTERDGDARNNTEALDRLNKAYAEVNNHIRDLVPKRAAKTASPRSAGSSANVKTAPTSMLEAVQSRLNQSRRA